jgi:quercetin dioxygenase-like cupin family protein
MHAIRGEGKMRSTKSMAMSTILLLATSVFATHALAIDFVEAAPKQTKVLIDNDKVRVIHVTNAKGDKIPMHTHPDLIVYVLKGGRIKFTNADGKVIETSTKTGEATFRPAVTHSHEHLDAGEAIVIELKK